jgi:hypothetical protein
MGVDGRRFVAPAPDGEISLLDGLSFEGHGNYTSGSCIG